MIGLRKDRQSQEILLPIVSIRIRRILKTAKQKLGIPVLLIGSVVTVIFEIVEEVIGLGGYGKTLTVLTIIEDLEDLEEQDELVESWIPRFKR